MPFQQPLSPELEAEAQELVARLRPQAEEELLALARLLVSKQDRELFGQTEFEVRDIVHRLGAKAYTAHLVGTVAQGTRQAIGLTDGGNGLEEFVRGASPPGPHLRFRPPQQAPCRAPQTPVGKKGCGLT